jgi:hypothetical protein
MPDSESKVPLLNAMLRRMLVWSLSLGLSWLAVKESL